MWLRTTEKKGVEFILSYKKDKYIWGATLNEFMETSNGYQLTIKSFKKQSDSGIYSCAFYNANALSFGKSIVLQGKPGRFILNYFLYMSLFCMFLF